MRDYIRTVVLALRARYIRSSVISIEMREISRPVTNEYIRYAV